MSNENMAFWEFVRQVPDDAKKAITGGRMNGKTDINPMWRIKKLTELFGPVGIGWYYDIVEQRLENGVNGEISAFVTINLYYKFKDEWSKPITGVGGNSFVSKDKNGLYQSDECFKMALTDAISVSCKAIGIGADVYWSGDKTKYDTRGQASQQSEKIKQELSDAQIKLLYTLANKKGVTNDQVKKVIIDSYKKTSTKELTKKEYDAIIKGLEAKEDVK